MSDDVPTYGEAIMNAVGAEAQAVLALMADVQKMRALCRTGRSKPPWWHRRRGN